MAIVHLKSGKNLSTTTLRGGYYSPSYNGNIDVSTTGGKDNGPSIRAYYHATEGQSWVVWYIIGNGYTQSLATAVGPTVIMGCRVKTSTNTIGSERQLFCLSHHSSGNNNTAVYVGTDRKVRVMYQDGLYTSWSTNAVDFATGVYLELKVYFHDTAGSLELRVNGTTVCSATNIDTLGYATSAAVTRYYIRDTVVASGESTYFSDIYIKDDGTFLGEICSEVIMPNGAGANSQWTASAGNPYECIDEVTPSSSDYIIGANNTDVSTFTYPDLQATNLGQIVAVQIRPWVIRNGSGTPTNFKTVVRSGGTNYFGSNILALDTERITPQIYLTDPQDSATWTASKVNAAEFGVQALT